MRKVIRRTICFSEITGSKTVLVEGSPVKTELEPIKISGKVNTEKAQRELRKAFGKDGLLNVENISIKEKVFEISVEDFLKHATEVVTVSEPSEN